MTAEIPIDQFVSYPKTPRLFREVIVSEKIDGSNACIAIGEDGSFHAGSRNRWVTLEADNFGFARWCEERKDELMKLGPGRHFGEFFGQGIQRHYNLKEKRFSLFNVARWADGAVTADKWEKGQLIPGGVPLSPRPACCGVVPVLYQGPFDTRQIQAVCEALAVEGSAAVPGYDKPEGVVIYHTAANRAFKVLLENDEDPKGE